MKLTPEQIKDFSHGCIDCTCENGIVTYARFTPGQVDAFEKRFATFRERCLRSSDVRIEFETDSRSILVDVGAAGKYEILVDGLAVLYKDCTDDDSLYAALPEGNKHITILLPWKTKGAISLIMLDENSYVKHHEFKRKFLFLGDSITQGASAARPSMTYVNRVARWFDADYLNLGVGGTKFFPEVLLKPELEPDTVFIAYGTNDFNSTPRDRFQRECREFMDIIKQWYPNKTVYVISPIWRLDHEMVRPAGTLQEVREYIMKQAEEHGFIHIDGWKLVPHDSDYFADVRLHPNDMGMSVYAEQLIKAITT